VGGAGGVRNAFSRPTGKRGNFTWALYIEPLFNHNLAVKQSCPRKRNSCIVCIVHVRIKLQQQSKVLSKDYA